MSKKPNLDECMDYILTADNETLVDLNNLIKDCFKKQSSKLKVTLKVGDDVKINGSNRIEFGKVLKVNRTRAVVRCWNKDKEFNVNYTVPFTMISKLTKEEEE